MEVTNKCGSWQPLWMVWMPHLLTSVEHTDRMICQPSANQRSTDIGLQLARYPGHSQIFDVIDIAATNKFPPNSSPLYNHWAPSAPCWTKCCKYQDTPDRSAYNGRYEFVESLTTKLSVSCLRSLLTCGKVEILSDPIDTMCHASR